LPIYTSTAHVTKKLRGVIEENVLYLTFYVHHRHHKSRRSCRTSKFASPNSLSVSPVARSVQCLAADWTTGVRSPTEAEDFSSNLCVQTGSGAHPASCTGGTEGSLSGGKARPGRDADHSPPSSAEGKKE
jgi:hypothetical protein